MHIYWDVYERRGSGELILVADIAGKDATAAMRNWIDRFGDNYGKVVILPQGPISKHHVYTVADSY